MRIEKLVRYNSIWYQMDGQKVQTSKLNIFDCTFGGVFVSVAPPIFSVTPPWDSPNRATNNFSPKQTNMNTNTKLALRRGLWGNSSKENDSLELFLEFLDKKFFVGTCLNALFFKICRFWDLVEFDYNGRNIRRKVGKWMGGWLGRHLEDWLSVDSSILPRFRLFADRTIFLENLDF